MPVPAARIELMRQGEAFFFSHVDQIDNDELSQPSGLPGWTRAHVVGHMARNADALQNLLSWARTGTESPMYPSVQARADGIEETSRKARDALRTDAHTTSERLQDAVAAMPGSAWDAPIRTASGRAVTGAEVPWMRIRESWIHAVDLGTGAAWDDIPEAVVIDLIDEVASGLATRTDCPAMVIESGARSWRVGGEDGDAVTVSGSPPELLAWLIGRAPGPAGAPAPPRWL
jgi:maleylpyruvate isomerase